MTFELVTIISLGIIFLGTTLGSSFVFIFKKNLSNRVNSIILGFASGIMIAAGFLGLLIPSIEEAKNIYGDYAVFPVIVGFILGGLLLFGLDKLIPHIHINSNEEEGTKNNKLSKNIKFFLAVTIHNIPEGIAVGFALGLAFNTEPNSLQIFSALSLAIGMFIQNVPEGTAIALPLTQAGMNKGKAFLLGTLSGAVEPIFGLLGLLLASSFTFLLPWLLAFSAGAMIYVTVDELLPSMREYGCYHVGIWAFMIGFSIMTILELVL